MASPAPELRKGTITVVEGVGLGVAGATPAGTIALYLGLLVTGAGVHAPAMVIASFIPMLFIAGAFYYMNRGQPDTGTVFAWASKALGPRVGWLSGWLMTVSTVIVVSNFGQLLGEFSLRTIGLTNAAANNLVVTIVGAMFLVATIAVAYLGIQLAARFQIYLAIFEVAVLVVFGVVALVKASSGSAPRGITPTLDWFNPFSIGSVAALGASMTIGVLWFWGWEQGVVVNEESANSSVGPGRAGILTTIVLVGFLLFLCVATISYAGTAALIDDPAAVLGGLGVEVFGPFAPVLFFVTFTSAFAGGVSLPVYGSRLLYSMARSGAAPSALGKIHPRFNTPSLATVVVGIAGVAYYVAMSVVSKNILLDSITAMGLLVPMYYAITGFSCVVYYRRASSRNPKHFLLAGVAPLVGGLLLGYVVILQAIDLRAPDNSSSGFVWFGVGAPLAIAIAAFLLGLAIMLAIPRWKPTFFERKRQVAERDALDATSSSDAPTAAAVVVVHGDTPLRGLQPQPKEKW